MKIKKTTIETVLLTPGVILELTDRESHVIAAALGRIDVGEVDGFLRDYEIGEVSAGFGGDDTLQTLYNKLASHFGF